MSLADLRVSALPREQAASGYVDKQQEHRAHLPAAPNVIKAISYTKGRIYFLIPKLQCISTLPLMQLITIHYTVLNGDLVA